MAGSLEVERDADGEFISISYFYLFLYGRFD